MSDAKKPKPKKTAAAKKKRERTEMCIHRRLPDQYCSRCDGGS